MITANEPPNDKTNKMACGPSENSDQPGMPGLIRVFAGRTVNLLVLSWGGGGGLRFFGCPILRIFTLFILSTFIIFTKETDFFNVISNVPYL